MFSHAARLAEIGLSVPQVTALFLRLRELGVDVDLTTFTVEQAVPQPARCWRAVPMLKDITLGQYFPGDTVVHRLDPRTKLLMVIVYIVALFLAKWVVSYQSCSRFSSPQLRCRAFARARCSGPEAAAVYHHFTAIINVFLYQGAMCWLNF